MNILLVEPNFPVPAKSKNHKDFLPIGLMKLYSYHLSVGNKAQLVRGNIDTDKIKFSKINQIWISSLFTYWFYCVEDSVEYYSKRFPEATILIGGIAASLYPEEAKTRLDADIIIKGGWGSALKSKERSKKPIKRIIVKGLENFAEMSSEKFDKKECIFTYRSMLNAVYKEVAPKIDFQIVHGQRGCIRHCKFCGVHIIEPQFVGKSSIQDSLVRKKNLVFYDNNFLAAVDNPTRVTNLFNELIELKKSRKIHSCESQSGFDGRILLKNPKYAGMLKEAGFRNIRIAWDGSYKERDYIKKQIDILTKKGRYNSKDIFVFMIYNWDIDYEEMEQKRKQCWRWGVQISDCRNRPLKLFDKQNYRPRIIGQNNEDYYVHPKWTDSEIKQFRRNIRRQNIATRQNLQFYSKLCEQKKIDKEKIRKLNSLKTSEAETYAKQNGIDLWLPGRKTTPISDQKLFDNHI